MFCHTFEQMSCQMLSKIDSTSVSVKMSQPYDLQRLTRLSLAESPDPAEVLDLAKALERRSNLWKEPGFAQDFSHILTPVAVLSSEIFALSSRSVIKRDLAAPILSASALLLDYILNTATEKSLKSFLNPLAALCTGSPSLESREKSEAIEAVREAKILPPGFAYDLGFNANENSASSASAFDSNENQDVINRPQTDLTAAILVQLRSPYEQSSSKYSDPCQFETGRIFNTGFYLKNWKLFNFLSRRRFAFLLNQKYQSSKKFRRSRQIDDSLWSSASIVQVH